MSKRWHYDLLWVKAWRPRPGSAFEQQVSGPAKCVFYRLLALVDDDGLSMLGGADPIDGLARLLDWPSGPPRRSLARYIDELVKHRCIDLGRDAVMVRKFRQWQRAGTERSALPRRKVFERDGWKCTYCGDPISMESGEVDHVVPFSRGGSDEMHNLAAACRPCNRDKGAKTPAEWVQ